MGFMLGSSCSECCKVSTDACCETGSLPDTVTVTFEGRVGNATQGPNLLYLAFHACYGSGASGYAEAPGRQLGPDGGPISAAIVSSKGSGYAILGRVAPTITASVSGGVGGELGTVTLGKAADGCGIPYWYVESIAVTKAGRGYEQDAGVTLTTATGDTTAIGGSASIQTRREEPTITLSGSGNGATFTPTIKSNGSDPPSWRISAVEVTGVTSGYEDEEHLSVTGPSLGFDYPAQLTVVVEREEPEVFVYAESATGSGALLEPTLSTQFDYDDPYYRDSWYVSSIAITSGGSGYVEGDPVYGSSSDPQSYANFFYAYVASVDGNGAITAIYLDGGGSWYRNSGRISYVDVYDGGAYFMGGVIDSIVVGNGGRYFREDEDEPPLVADVTVTLIQGYPSNGSGAEFTANVDTDTASEDFGKIVSVTVDSAGDNYLGWDYLYGCGDCEWVYGGDPPQDHSVVCWRQTAPWDNNCVYIGSRCWLKQLDELNTYPLLWLRVSSKIRDFRPSGPYYLYPSAPIGIPGVDNGPITDPIENYQELQLAGGWAYCGRSVLVPDRVFQNEWAGEEAVIVATMSPQRLYDDYLPYWEVVSVAVTSGGSGYTNGQEVEIYSSEAGYDFYNLFENRPQFWYDIPSPEFRTAKGTVTTDEDGAITAIQITEGGVFYFEDTTQPAIAPEVTVTVEQSLPSQGSGAVVVASIDTDPLSGSFGYVMSLSISEGGDGYLLATSADFNAGTVIVTYPGADAPPTVEAYRYVNDYPVSGGCGVTYTADEPVTDCSDFSFVASSGEATATVAPGGDVTTIFQGRNKCCGRCDTCCPDAIEQIVITFKREATEQEPMVFEDDHKPTGGIASLCGRATVFNTGDFFGNQAKIDCESDEQEIIIDILDVFENNECAQKEFAFSKTSTSEPMEFVPFEPGSECDSTLLTRPTNLALSEYSYASVTVKIIGLAYGTPVCRYAGGGDMVITTRTVWHNTYGVWDGLIPGAPPSAAVDKTKTYTLTRVVNEEDSTVLAREECGTFPGNWELVESGTPEEDEPCLQNVATNTFCEPPCEIPEGLGNFEDYLGRRCGPNATPGVIVHAAPEVGENYLSNLRLLYPRRACKDYEIEVEIQ